MTRSVYLAVPTYTAQPHVETFDCLLRGAEGVRRAGFGLNMKFSVGNSLISHARDSFAADFLQTDCSDLVMVDDDLAWEDDALLRLLSHPVDVVGGIYPKREAPIQFPVKRLAGEEPDGDGLLKVAMLPGGFLRISRRCVVAMWAHYSELEYSDDRVPGGRNCAIFLPELRIDPATGDRRFWGEDFMFCQRWRDMGGDVFADTLLNFRHIGRAAYQGRYADYLPETTEAGAE